MINLSFKNPKMIGEVEGKKIFKSCIEVSIKILDFLSLPLFPKFFFKPKGKRTKYLAIGSLLTFSPEKALKVRNKNYRFYGGVCFDEKVDDVWCENYCSEFFLPIYEIVETSKKTVFSFYSFQAKDHCLHFYPKNVTKPIIAKKQTHTPDLLGFKSLIEKYQNLMKTSPLKKVVACRRSAYSLNTAPDFKLLLTHLLKLSHSTVFAFIKEEDKGFFGASPEMLFQRKNKILVTEAIARTRKRGKNRKEDLNYASDLKNNPKDLEEFLLVEKSLLKNLQAISPKVTLKKNLLYKNPYIQHLYSKLFAYTEEDSYSILKKLHPTPAIGGYPKNLAYQTTCKEESFSRRFYCSALGFKDDTEEILAVGIRSFFIDTKRLYLYTGVGIVPSSCFKSEWEELDIKSEAILKGAGIEY